MESEGVYRLRTATARRVKNQLGGINGSIRRYLSGTRSKNGIEPNQSVTGRAGSGVQIGHQILAGGVRGVWVIRADLCIQRARVTTKPLSKCLHDERWWVDW